VWKPLPRARREADSNSASAPRGTGSITAGTGPLQAGAVPAPFRSHTVSKNNQRLEYGRLAEVLAERGLVEPQALREALQFSLQGNMPFPEALVTANLVADWELSRVVCEIYNLPFLSVDATEVDTKARQGIDPQFIQENALVPLFRFGQVLTVCMPALVPAEVLGLLAAETDLFIVPVVGTVRTNRKWIESNLKQDVPLAALPNAGQVQQDLNGGAWSSIFDQGDAAVLSGLTPPPGKPGHGGTRR
jgi:hypothetical protein